MYQFDGHVDELNRRIILEFGVEEWEELEGLAERQGARMGRRLSLAVFIGAAITRQAIIDKLVGDRFKIFAFKWGKWLWIIPWPVFIDVTTTVEDIHDLTEEPGEDN